MSQPVAGAVEKFRCVGERATVEARDLIRGRVCAVRQGLVISLTS